LQTGTHKTNFQHCCNCTKLALSSWIYLQGSRNHQSNDLAALFQSPYLFFFFKIYLFIICKYTVAVFRHSRKGVRSCYRWLWATMWLLGFELWTFGRAVGCPYPLSHLTSPQSPYLNFLLNAGPSLLGALLVHPFLYLCINFLPLLELEVLTSSSPPGSRTYIYAWCITGICVCVSVWCNHVSPCGSEVNLRSCLFKFLLRPCPGLLT
jgi:hypothetical protein